MIRTLSLTTILVALAAAVTPASAQKQRVASDANGNLDALIARHAAANNLPEDLVRRVIKRESGGRAHVVSAGNYGLMQIKLPTARSMGYTGTAAGLLDAGVVDALALFLAPRLIGADGRPLLGSLGVSALADAPALLETTVREVGPDVLVEGLLQPLP